MEIIELNYGAAKPKFKGIFQPPAKNGGGRMYPTNVLSSNINNAKYLKEAEELSKRWEKLGLLDNMFVATTPGGHWLDGQRLTNEQE